MHSHLSGWKDTIAAIATPPGIGGIGIIRVSGEQAYPVVQQLFTKKNLEELQANTLHVGLLQDEGEVLDEVVLSLFRKPHSFTGEDVIEISCHGSPFILQQVLD
ncbi:MAG TPA: tRNA uridine-5-carboxymethylaminomethyl(34) synthesis GTPase MnmE, partial [Ginsengibacter sp.]|nr:tRNA uridine-5-carboxymethylaminomethyl(34) synthesis GTPase MnmE [Ginsengibacter sp.]